MKKILILLPILLVLLVVAPVFAQEQIDVLEFESSMVMGYDFLADDVAQTQRFGVNFNLSDSLDAGFMFQQGGINYTAGSFLVLRYAMAEQVALGIMYGNVGTAAGGLNVAYDLLSNDVQGLSTVLRLNMEYLLEDITGPVDEGIFGVSLSLGFGI